MSNATFYVNSDWTGRTGEVEPGKTIGVNAFAYYQDAVTAANAFDETQILFANAALSILPTRIFSPEFYDVTLSSEASGGVTTLMFGTGRSQSPAFAKASFQSAAGFGATITLDGIGITHDSSLADGYRTVTVGMNAERNANPDNDPNDYSTNMKLTNGSFIDTYRVVVGYNSLLALSGKSGSASMNLAAEALFLRGAVEASGENSVVNIGSVSVYNPGVPIDGGTAYVPTIALSDGASLNLSAPIDYSGAGDSKFVISGKSGAQLALTSVDVLNAHTVLSLDGGDTAATLGMVDNAGAITLSNGAKLSATAIANTGSVEVNGFGVELDGTMTGNAVKLISGGLTESELTASVDVYGDSKLSGNNTVAGSIRIGYGDYTADAAKLGITGTATTDNVYVGNDNDTATAYALNIGDAAGARTTAKAASLYVRQNGTLDVVNADLTYGYLLTYGAVNFVNSFATMQNGVNTYIVGRGERNADGKAIMTLDNSTLDLTNRSINIGDMTSEAAIGSGKLIMSNNSVLNAATLNLAPREAESTIGEISATATGSTIALTSTLSVGERAALTLTDSTLTTANFTNKGAVEFNSGSTLSFSGAFSNTGTITVDMTDATNKGVYKLIDNTGSTAMTLANYGTVNLTGAPEGYALSAKGNDLFAANVDMTKLQVSAAWADFEFGETILIDGVTYYYGFNAFSDFKQAFVIATGNSEVSTIQLQGGSNTTNLSGWYSEIAHKVTITSDEATTLVANVGSPFYIGDGGTVGWVVLDKNVHFLATDSPLYIGSAYGLPDVVFEVNGTLETKASLNVGELESRSGIGTLQVNAGGKVLIGTGTSAGNADFILRGNKTRLILDGSEEEHATIDSTRTSARFYGGTITADYADWNALNIDLMKAAGYGTKVSFALTNSTLSASRIGLGTAEDFTAEFDIKNSVVTAGTVSNAGAISLDLVSNFSFSGSFSNTGTITVDMTGVETGSGAYKLIDNTGATVMTVGDYGNVMLTGAPADMVLVAVDNDLYAISADMSTLKVNAEWASKQYGELVEKGYYYGFNAFSTVKAGLAKAITVGGADIVTVGSGETPVYDSSNIMKMDGASGMSFTLTGGNPGTESIAIEMRNADKSEFTERTTLDIFDADLALWKIAAYQNAAIKISNSDIDFLNSQNGVLYTKGTGTIEVVGSTLVNNVQLSAYGALMKLDNSTLESGSSNRVQGAMEVVNGSFYSLSSAVISNDNGSLLLDGSTMVRKAVRSAEDKANTLTYAEGSDSMNSPFRVEVGVTDYNTSSETPTGTGSFTVSNGATFDFSKAYAESHYAGVEGAETSEGLVVVGAGSMLSILGGAATPTTFRVDQLLNAGTINVTGDSTLDADMTLTDSGRVIFGSSTTAFAGSFDKTINGTASANTTIQVLNGTLDLVSGANINLAGSYSTKNGFVLGTLTAAEDDGTITAAVTVKARATLSSPNYFWIGSANGAYETPEDQSARFQLIIDGGTVDAAKNAFTIRNTGAVEIKNGGSLTANDGNVRNKLSVTGTGSVLNFGGNVYGEAPTGVEGAPAYGTASITISDGAVAHFKGTGTLVIGGSGASRTNRRGELILSNAAADAVNITLSQANDGEEARGRLSLTASTLTMTGALLNYGKVEMDYKSLITADTIANNNTITVDMSGANETGAYKLIDNTGTSAMTVADYGSVTLNNDATGAYRTMVLGNDLFAVNADMTTIKVSAAWADTAYGTEVETGYFLGVNAFSVFEDAGHAIVSVTGEIKVETDTTFASGSLLQNLPGDLTISTSNAEGVTIMHDPRGALVVNTASTAEEKATFTIGAGVTLCNYSAGNSTGVNYFGYNGSDKGIDLVVNGTVDGYIFYNSFNSTTVVNETGRIYARAEQMLARGNGSTITINGAAAQGAGKEERTLQATAGYLQMRDGGRITLNDTYFRLTSGAVSVNYYSGTNSSLTLDNTYFEDNGHSGTRATAVAINAGNGAIYVRNQSVMDASGAYRGATFKIAGDGRLEVAGSSVVKGYTSVTNAGTIAIDATSRLTAGGISNTGAIAMYNGSLLSFGGTFANTGTITVDMADASAIGVYKLVDNTGSTAMTLADYGTVSLINNGYSYATVVVGNDLFAVNADMTTIKVNAAWADTAYGAEVETGYFLGFNAFSSAAMALESITADSTAVVLDSSVTEEVLTPVVRLTRDLTLSSGSSDPMTVTWNVTGNGPGAPDTDGKVYILGDGVNRSTLTIAENVTVKVPETDDYKFGGAFYLGFSSATPINVQLDGTLDVYLLYVGSGSKLHVSKTGKIITGTENLIVRHGAEVVVDGNGAWSVETPQIKTGYTSIQGGSVTLNDTVMNSGAWLQMWNRNNVADDGTTLTLNNSRLIAGAMQATANGTAGYVVTLNNSTIELTGAFANISTVKMDAESSITASSFSNTGTITVDMADASATGVYKLVDNTGSTGMTVESYGSVTLTNNLNEYNLLVNNNDLYAVKADMSTFKVNSAWSNSSYGDKVESGFYYGVNAFHAYDDALNSFTSASSTIVVNGNVSSSGVYLARTHEITNNGTIAGVVVEEGLGNGNRVVTVTNKLGATMSNNADGSYVFSSAHSIILDNSGTIEATGTGASAFELWFDPAYTRAHSIENSGTISGSKYAFYTSAAWGASTPVAAEEFVLNNSGTITGGESAFRFDLGGTARIVNSGTINGAISFFDGADILTQTGGEINGDIDMGGGADVLNLLGGSVSGSITMNDADDVTTITGATINAVNIANGGKFNFNGSRAISFSGSFSNTGTITVDMADASATGVYKLVDNTGSTAMTLADYGTVSLINAAGGYQLEVRKNDLYAINVDMTTIMVDDSWESNYEFGQAIVGYAGYYYGVNAFDSFRPATLAANAVTSLIAINSANSFDFMLSNTTTAFQRDILVKSNETNGSLLELQGANGFRFMKDNSVKERVTVTLDNVRLISLTAQHTSGGSIIYVGQAASYHNEPEGLDYAVDMVLQNGACLFGKQLYVGLDSTLTVNSGSSVNSKNEAFIVRGAVTVNGSDSFNPEEAKATDLQFNASYLNFMEAAPGVAGILSPSVTLHDSYAKIGAISTSASAGDTGVIPWVLTADHSRVEVASELTVHANATMNLLNGTVATAATVANAGAVVMDYSSSLSFSGTFANTGAITVDMNGAGATGVYKLIDNIGSTVMTLTDYGSVTLVNNTGYTLSVIDNDLYAHNTATVYVSSLWSGLDNGVSVTLNDGTTGYIGINAFADYATAQAAAPGKIVTESGTYSSLITFNGIASTVEAGSFERQVSGGFITNAAPKGWDDYAGDIYMTFSGGKFAKTVNGADIMQTGSSERVGNVNMNISGGEFAQQVAGGLFLTHQDAKGLAHLSGDVNLTISGGEFNDRIYGGNLSMNSNSSRTTIEGNINLTIDSSLHDIVINEHIVAGSFGDGRVTGNVNVTVSGLGEKLTFTNALSGASGNAYYYNDENGDRQCQSYIDGDRNLSFSGFTGTFSGTIVAFEKITFTDGSNVAFDNANLNFADISEWEFSFGSMLSGLANNDFTGDSMVLDLDGWDHNEWTVASGSEMAFEGFEQLSDSGVLLGGQNANWNDDLSAWCSADYKLALCAGEEGRKMVLSIA